jgi:hypothetical protein
MSQFTDGCPPPWTENYDDHQRLEKRIDNLLDRIRELEECVQDLEEIILELKSPTPRPANESLILSAR